MLTKTIPQVPSTYLKRLDNLLQSFSHSGKEDVNRLGDIATEGLLRDRHASYLAMDSVHDNLITSQCTLEHVKSLNAPG